MLKTVYVVYHEQAKESWDEVGRFYKKDKAIEFAKSVSPSRIDIDTWNISRNGRELLETISDFMTFTGGN